MMPAAGTATRIGVSPDAARSERVRREQARRNFLKFCQYVDPRYETPAHVRYVAEKLQQVARYIESGGQDGIGRLMIELPPRHGKSEMASRKFPAYFLGRRPDSRIILASYGADLASKHSRAVRDLVMSTRYQALFGGLSSKDEPVELSSDSRSVAAWDLAAPHRGGMVAAGVGGGITGLGADLLILDDLFKNREEGESEARRDFVDDWYKSSAYTRLEPFAAIILFFTRWHPDDQAGKLIQRMATADYADDQMAQMGADQWEIVCLPALAYGDYPADAQAQRAKMAEGVYVPLADPLGRKAGEALWPNRFGVEWLEAKRRNIDLYEFEALYQQMPYLREGGFFKREWFSVVDKGPGKEAVMRIRYWDKASTPGGGDFTAGVLISRDKDGIYYIEHVARGQWSPGERDRKMAEIGKQDYEQLGVFTIWHQQDPGSAGKDSAMSTSAVMAEAGLTARFEPVTGDKEVRAGPLSSAAQAGKVKLVKGNWLEPFLSEVTAFPKGRFDDQVDAGASAFNKAREMRKKKTAMSYEG
jgi:predicted phage terminase large subunit-like protein